MRDLVKKLRKQPRLNQVDFGRAIGRSLATIQGYEAGKRVPPQVIERMYFIALDAGLSVPASEIRSQAETVQKNSHSPGIVVDFQPLKKNTDAINLKKKHERWHAMLDEVLNSGSEDATAAVKRNLQVFHDYVQLQRARAKRKRA